jgi:hypothetical protein
MFEFSFERVDFWIQFDGTRGGEGHVSRSFGASVAVRSITARPKLAASRHSGRVRVDGARSPPALLVPGRPPPNETDSLLSWRVR